MEELVEVGEVQARGIGRGEGFGKRSLRRRRRGYYMRRVQERGLAFEASTSCLEHVKIVCWDGGADHLHHT